VNKGGKKDLQTVHVPSTGEGKIGPGEIKLLGFRKNGRGRGWRDRSEDAVSSKPWDQRRFFRCHERGQRDSIGGEKTFEELSTRLPGQKKMQGVERESQGKGKNVGDKKASAMAVEKRKKVIRRINS